MTKTTIKLCVQFRGAYNITKWALSLNIGLVGLFFGGNKPHLLTNKQKWYVKCHFFPSSELLLAFSDDNCRRMSILKTYR